MKKSKINFIIDVLMFVIMFFIGGTGFLLKYIFISGKERWVKYGSNVDMILFGMDSHEWETVHYILGIILFGLLALHIILHWKIILCLYRKLIKSQKVRTMITVIFIIISLILLFFPFVMNVTIQKSENTRRHQEATSSQVTNLQVRGYMTLKEVSEKYNVPIEHLKNKLNIPKATVDEEEFSQLKRKYGFGMVDVIKTINDYKIQNKCTYR